VERIMDERTKRVGRGTRREFLVKWTGYNTPTWTPATNLEDMQALDEWEAREGSNVMGTAQRIEHVHSVTIDFMENNL
jgi:chromodomain-containing protein